MHTPPDLTKKRLKPIPKQLYLITNHSTISYKKAFNYLTTQLFNGLSIRFPHTCILCHTSCQCPACLKPSKWPSNPTKHSRLCLNCQGHFLERLKHQCLRCALPLPQKAPFCGDCLSKPHYFQRTICLYSYNSWLALLLLRFKEKRDFYAGKALSQLLTSSVKQYYLQQHLPLPDYLIPVPLHWRKRWKRGFNHALFFAKELSHALNIGIYKGAVRHDYHTAQKQLNKKDRQQKNHNQFSVKTSFKGQHIAIIDDVMTSKATANALAKTLHRAGAKSVTLWILARTPKRQ